MREHNSRGYTYMHGERPLDNRRSQNTVRMKPAGNRDTVERRITSPSCHSSVQKSQIISTPHKGRRAHRYKRREPLSKGNASETKERHLRITEARVVGTVRAPFWNSVSLVGAGARRSSVAHGRRRRVVVPLEVLQRERVGHVHGRQLAGGRARQQLGGEPARQLVVAAAWPAHAAQLWRKMYRLR